MEEHEIPFTNSAQSKTLLVENMAFRSANDFLLTENDFERAHRELGETEVERNECVKRLKEKVLRDKGMTYRTDDNYLLRYLRYRKFNCDEAFRAMRKLYAFRMEYPEMMSMPLNLQSVMNSGIYTYLPYRTQEGNIIILIKAAKWKIEEVQASEIMQMVTCIADVLCTNPSSQIHGLIIIYDAKGITANQIAQFLQPRMLKMWTRISQDVFPFRITRIVVLHCNRLIRISYYTLKHFLKKKITERLVFLGSNMRELHKYVDPVLLPPEYGGGLKENAITFTQFVLNNLCYLKYDRSFGYI